MAFRQYGSKIAAVRHEVLEARKNGNGGSGQKRQENRGNLMRDAVRAIQPPAFVLGSEGTQ